MFTILCRHVLLQERSNINMVGTLICTSPMLGVLLHRQMLMLNPLRHVAKDTPE